MCLPPQIHTRSPAISVWLRKTNARKRLWCHERRMNSSKNVTIHCLMCKQLHKRPCNKRRSTSAVPCVSWPSQVCPFLPCHCLLVPCIMVPCLAMFACLVWSGLVLCCLSTSVFYCLVVSCRVCLLLHCLTLPYLASPRCVSSRVVLYCLSGLVFFCLVLSCPRLCLSKLKLCSKGGPRGSPLLLRLNLN